MRVIVIILVSKAFFFLYFIFPSLFLFDLAHQFYHLVVGKIVSHILEQTPVLVIFFFQM